MKRLKAACRAFLNEWKEIPDRTRWPNGDLIYEIRDLDPKDIYFFGYSYEQLADMVRKLEERGELPHWDIPLLEITPLKGKYCPHCTQSLLQFHLAIFSIVPMCRACLDQFMNNGDREICAKLMAEGVK